MSGMRLYRLLTDDRAVAPVIGIVLMIAITVALTALTGVFVIGFGEELETAGPSASFEFDFSDNTGSDILIVTHDGGDAVKAGRLSIVGDDHLSIDTDGSGFNGDARRLSVTADSLSSSDTVSAATTFIIQPGPSASDTQLDDETVRIIWTSETTAKSATLGEFAGPNV